MCVASDLPCEAIQRHHPLAWHAGWLAGHHYKEANQILLSFHPAIEAMEASLSIPLVGSVRMALLIERSNASDMKWPHRQMQNCRADRSDTDTPRPYNVGFCILIVDLWSKDNQSSRISPRTTEKREMQLLKRKIEKPEKPKFLSLMIQVT